jgi:hypothetical protein
MYRLNRGAYDDAGGRWQGFDLSLGAQRYGKGGRARLLDQWISPEYSVAGFDSDPVRPGANELWLAAPKTTDALFIAPTVSPAGLRPHLVGTGTQRVTAVRAAAISAACMIVNRAAMDLDIDPEEFDVLEPRIHRNTHGATVPLLQVADHLVNGAGFCDRLARIGESGSALIVEVVRAILEKEGQYPLADLFKPDGLGGTHATSCDQACYRCLQRYSNQAFHGLLDWRLGLAFLEVLRNSAWTCGLDGPFDGPALQDWQKLAEKYAHDMLRFSGTGEVRNDVAGLVAFRFDTSRPHWALVVHPLWDVSQLPGRVGRAYQDLDRQGAKIEMVDTFQLARRQVLTRETLLEKWRR